MWARTYTSSEFVLEPRSHSALLCGIEEEEVPLFLNNVACGADALHLRDNALPANHAAHAATFELAATRPLVPRRRLRTYNTAELVHRSAPDRSTPVRSCSGPLSPRSGSGSGPRAAAPVVLQSSGPEGGAAAERSGGRSGPERSGRIH